MSKFPPIGMTEVFSRLHCRPEIFANCFKIFTHSLRYSGFLWMKILVSSAKVSERDSFLAYIIPFRFLVWLILIKIISTDFQAIINVFMGQTIEGFFEIN